MWQEPASCRRQSCSNIDCVDISKPSVKVQAPIFTGRSAELPVQITEGRQYTIARLDVRAATSRSSAQVPPRSASPLVRRIEPAASSLLAALSKSIISATVTTMSA